ncbi:hypothetical protein FM106_18740 [Brachybacterium faecium]|nr:hypothetical protein FM106_18740 [Brachybacterium faecium]
MNKKMLERMKKRNTERLVVLRNKLENDEVPEEDLKAV